MTIYTDISTQPAILTHRCGVCNHIWQEMKYPRRDGSYPDARCQKCEATKPAGTATEKP